MRFKNRELGGIKLFIKDDFANSSRNQHRFIKMGGKKMPVLKKKRPFRSVYLVDLWKRLAS